MKRLLIQLGLLGVVILASPTMSSAGTLGLQSFLPSLGTTPVQRYGALADLTIGWSFTVGPQSVSVTDLGFFDYNGDGLDTAHEVGLWNSSGSLLTSVTVPAGTGGTLVDGFRFTLLSSALDLVANQGYVIGAHITVNSGDIFYTATSATLAPEFTFGTPLDDADPAVGFVQPVRTRPDVGFGFFGPNFRFVDQVSAVPEPGTLALLALGMAGAGVARRRRRR